MGEVRNTYNFFLESAKEDNRGRMRKLEDNIKVVLREI
jgi:hypothetical protein